MHRSSFTSSVHDVSCHNNSFYLSLGGLPLHFSSSFLFFFLRFAMTVTWFFLFISFYRTFPYDVGVWCDSFEFPFLCPISFSYELLQNGEGNYGNCTIQDPIARTNDFLLIFFYCAFAVRS